jgi:hypothetical protein
MKARHRPMQVAARIVETGASTAHELLEIQVLAAPVASGAQEPGSSMHIPINQNPVPVDQNIDRPGGELVGFFAPSESGHRAFQECAVPVQLEHVEACPIFDQAVERKMGGVRIVEQSEGAWHRSEIVLLRGAGLWFIQGSQHDGGPIQTF